MNRRRQTARPGQQQILWKAPEAARRHGKHFLAMLIFIGAGSASAQEVRVHWEPLDLAEIPATQSAWNQPAYSLTNATVASVQAATHQTLWPPVP